MPTAETDKTALREGLAETLWDQSYAYLRDAPWDGALVIARDIPDGRTAAAVKAAHARADELLAGPFASVLAQAEADRAALSAAEARAARWPPRWRRTKG